MESTSRKSSTTSTAPAANSTKSRGTPMLAPVVAASSRFFFPHCLSQKWPCDQQDARKARQRSGERRMRRQAVCWRQIQEIGRPFLRGVHGRTSKKNADVRYARNLQVFRSAIHAGSYQVGGIAAHGRQLQRANHHQRMRRQTGGSLNNSFSAVTPCSARIGAGEMAIKPTTESREAIRIAIAPPMECPASIMRLREIAPRVKSSRTSDSPHSSARAGENGPGVRPWPGRSGT